MQKIAEITDTLVIRIDKETKERFREACDDKMSATIRALIEMYLLDGGRKIARRTAKHSGK